MNINERTKSTIIYILLILFGLATVAFLFSPEYLRLPYSMDKVTELRSEIENASNVLTRNEDIIENLITDRESAKIEAGESKKQAQELLSEFNEDLLVYHLPSLLISLEQGANSLQIENHQFFIDYDEIRTQGDESEQDTPTDETLPPNEPNNSEESPITEKSEEAELPDETTTTDLYSSDDMRGDPAIAHAKLNPPTIDGLTVTTVPLRIVGVSYSQARAYIDFLTELDFVEPGFIDIYSKGDQISLITVLYVFHKQAEGGGNIAN